MSVREEDRNKNCPSRGLGIAAAAIGVGVGAALYYFFSKRSENPADEGATTSGWNCERLHTLHHNHDSSYTTISEHSTTDTSVHDTSSESEDYDHHRYRRNILQAISRRLWHNDSTDDADLYNDSASVTEYSISSDEDVQLLDSSVELNLNISNEANGANIGSDSDANMEWDVTTSSLDIPRVQPGSRSPIMMQFGELTVRLLNPQGALWNRERTWTLEQCSICFENMLKNQEVFELSCTHRFHQACIMPWLQQQQTCPMCRKAS